MVNPDLSLPGFPEVFAIGDIASVFQKDGSPVPGVSPAAMQMGRHVAGLIEDELEFGRENNTRRAFEYFDKGTMATIGRSRAVALIQGVRLHGFVAWMAWLFVHLLFLVGLRNKLAVVLNWMYAYFAYRPGARIITGDVESVERDKAENF
jgi:NADH dehydrogenase